MQARRRGGRCSCHRRPPSAACSQASAATRLPIRSCSTFAARTRHNHERVHEDKHLESGGFQINVDGPALGRSYSGDTGNRARRSLEIVDQDAHNVAHLPHKRERANNNVAYALHSRCRCVVVAGQMHGSTCIQQHQQLHGRALALFVNSDTDSSHASAKSRGNSRDRSRNTLSRRVDWHSSQQRGRPSSRGHANRDVV